MSIADFIAKPGDKKPFAGRFGSRKHPTLEYGPFRIQYAPRTSQFAFDETVEIVAGLMTVRPRMRHQSISAMHLLVDGVEWQIYVQYCGSKVPAYATDLWKSEGRLFA